MAGVAKAQTDNPLNLLDSVSTVTAAMITHIANATLYLETGASHHMLKHKSAFTRNEETDNMEVMMADGNKIQAPGKGAAVIHTVVGFDIVLEDAPHVPGIAANLLSVSVITGKGRVIKF